MAKKEQMPMEHMKDGWCRCFGWLVLLIGVWFLLTDLGMLPDYNIHWWSVLFLLVGVKLVWKQFGKR